MGKNPNGKPRRKKNSRTRRKRWNLRKNRCKRTLHPTARFLENRFPSISYDLRISYLLTYSLFSIWLVCEYHYTRAECLRLNKFEFLLLALTMKKPLPVSYYNGEDHETVFINEILLHERVNELNATKDQDVLTRLLFQSGNFLSNIVLDKGGIPLSFLQSCGWNILGHPVYSFAICTSSTRPGGCKSLIGYASQKECIAGKKLIKFIFL